MSGMPHDSAARFYQLHLKAPQRPVLEPLTRPLKLYHFLTRISHMDHKFCRTECRFLV